MNTPTAESWYRQGDWFTFRGHRIWMRDSGGPGAPLLLLHGFPTASWDWYRLWDELCRDYRVLCFDMLGFGWSDKPRGHAYSLVEQADLATELLRSLSLDRVHLLAHDYGDSVAQELMARHQEGGSAIALRSVCLLNGGIIPGAHRPTRIQKLLASPLGWLVGRLLSRERFMRNFSAVFGADTQPSEAELEACWQLVSHNQGTRIAHRLIGYMRERERHLDRWVGVIRQNPVPLIFVNGTADPVSGEPVAEAFQTLNPYGALVRLDNIGHYPQLEAPEAVLSALREFHRQLDD